MKNLPLFNTRRLLRHPSRGAVGAALPISATALRATQEADATMSPDLWACDYPALAPARPHPATGHPEPPRAEAA